MITGAAVVLLIGLASILWVGAAVALRPTRWTAVVRRWASRPSLAATLARARTRRTGLDDRFGPVAPFLMLMAAAMPPIALACHLLGVAVQERPVADIDERLNAWFLDQWGLAEWLRELVQKLNHIANWPETLTVAFIASLALGFVSHRRRWMPALLIYTVVFVEWCLQTIVNITVDPSPPPTGAGLFPSGGTARVIGVYGFILYLVLQRTRPGWRVTVAGCTAIALTAFLQAFSRIHAGYHWTSDIAGGVLLGSSILVISLAAAATYDAGAVPEATRRREPGDRMALTDARRGG